MKIRFLTTISGVSITFRAGQVIEVAAIPAELRPFVDGIRAEIMPEEETAAGTAPEAAMLPPAQPRRGRRGLTH